MRQLTAEATQRFPQWARILTVRARVSRDATAARQAVAINPNYLPARVVLADILVDAGDWAEAEKLVRQPRNLDGVRDVFTVRRESSW